MRLPPRLMMLLIAPLVGCAELDPPDDGGTDSPFDIITLACRNSVDPELTAFVNWELGVTAEPIESGEPFTAALDGMAVFEESFLDDGQVLIPGGVKEVNLVDFNATVHVRSGAFGADVVLAAEPIPYVCDFDRKACDPANDVLDDPPKPPGLRGNTDCKPVSAANPCGRFMLLPISNDCNPGGVCDERGKLHQCMWNNFCVIGGLRVQLREAQGQYTANVQGEKVLFGWDDESTGATLRQEGPNAGTWILPPAVYEEPTGPNGFRLTIGGYLVALECTMGVDCIDDLGTPCDFIASPTPDSALISLPIN